MSITIDQAQGKVPVTILSVQGDLDASNYQDVIDSATQAYEAGARDILIDMSEIKFMSSSGLVALHSIALLMRGEELPDPEYGWEAFRTLDRDRESGVQEHVKLLNPQPKVDRSLEITGLKQFFEIYTDLDTALASFG
jgi:anti-anti-sigma regulatory factor